MDYFTIVDDAQAVTCLSGVYRQSPVYERAGRLQHEPAGG